MKMGLDFDGVITDCGQLKSRAAEELFGLHIPPERFKKELLVPKVLSAEQYRQMQVEIYTNPARGLGIPEVPGAVEYLERLLRERHSLEVITSRDREALEIAREWLRSRNLQIPCTGLGYGADKSAAVRGMNVYVDDDLDKLQPLVGVVPHRYLFGWGYNRHVETDGIASRVESWEELYGKIRALRIKAIWRNR